MKDNCVLIHFPLDPNYKHNKTFINFLQRITHRKIQGKFRYGVPSRRKLYLSRLKKELEEYERSGNYEQLLNIAVYCWLESVAPENEKFHFDATVKSVTRKEETNDL